MRNGIGMAFVNSGGNLYFAVHEPKTLLPDSSGAVEIIVHYNAAGTAITARWSGARSSPTLMLAADDPDNQPLVCRFLDDHSAIYLAECQLAGSASHFPGLWPSRSEVVKKKPLFGDWSHVKSTPTLARRHGTIYMCLTDDDGGIYMATSADGRTWPDMAEVVKHRQFGGQHAARKNPSLVVFGDDRDLSKTIKAGADFPLVMAFAAADGGALWVADSDDGLTFGGHSPLVPWLSFADQFRWSPYDHLNHASIDVILEYLDFNKHNWKKDRMFISQCLDTPLVSPIQQPEFLEGLYGHRLNEWVMHLKAGDNANVVYRDFVTHYQHVVDHLIGLNFAS